MAAEEGILNQPRAPEDLSPLGKLEWQIRTNKYKLTAQEGEVIGKCGEDAMSHYINGPLFAGTIFWTMAGKVKMKFFPKVVLTAVACAAGYDFGTWRAEHHCMKRIVALEGSPLRGELIAILREDFPNHPLVKGTVKQHQTSMSDPMYEAVDYSQDSRMPTSSKDWSWRIDSNISTSGDSVDGEGLRRIPRLWNTQPKQVHVDQESGEADVLADPFDLIMQIGFDDASGSEGGDHGGSKANGNERRRSRMSARERRDYDRRQYQQRREQHKI